MFQVLVKINETERILVDVNTDIANTCNKYFASIFTKDEDGSFEQDLPQDNIRIIDNVTLSEGEIVAVISNLDSKKVHRQTGLYSSPITEEDSCIQITPSLPALFSNSLRPVYTCNFCSDFRCDLFC